MDLPLESRLSERGLLDARGLLRHTLLAFYKEMISIEHTQRAWRQILDLGGDENLAFMCQPFLNAPVGTEEEKLEARETLCRIRGGDSKCTRNMRHDIQMQDALIMVPVTMELADFLADSVEERRNELEEMVVGEPKLKEALDRFLDDYAKAL
ncbi:hypothetical protein CSOJ01_07689 [Colletotrichum sojae]|uniref:Uncharacterized protein n=1 Tax=Colletotrichum sojae TaxID=2175907 RepID=A0A8H6J7Z0_9PEZI|nr:hypothetical protein CSOJ01_07689 [Colletotrichum sojae]